MGHLWELLSIAVAIVCGIIVFNQVGMLVGDRVVVRIASVERICVGIAWAVVLAYAFVTPFGVCAIVLLRTTRRQSAHEPETIGFDLADQTSAHRIVLFERTCLFAVWGMAIIAVLHPSWAVDAVMAVKKYLPAGPDKRSLLDVVIRLIIFTGLLLSWEVTVAQGRFDLWWNVGTAAKPRLSVFNQIGSLCVIGLLAVVCFLWFVQWFPTAP